MHRFADIALILTASLTLAACGESSPDAGAGPAAATSASPGSSSSSSSSASGSSQSDDESAIRAAGASKDKAFGTGNADFIASLFEDDAVLMPPTAPAAKGSAAIRKYFAADMSEASQAGYDLFVSPGSVDIRVSGDIAYRSGIYGITDSDGGTVDTGKWLEVWHKDGGKWRITRDIWNSDSLPLLVPDEGDDANDSGASQ